MIHPPEVSDESWFGTAMAGIGIFGGWFVLSIIRGWKGFKSDEKGEPQSFILERAELANLVAMPRHLQELGPKLEDILTMDRGNRDLLQANSGIMKEMLNMLQRIETEGILRSKQDARDQIERIAREAAERVAREERKG